MTFETREAAEAALLTDGFKLSTIGTGLYVGPKSMTHGYEPISVSAIVEIIRHNVAKEYGGGAYFSHRFH